jgi:hypothetical protein
LFEEEIWRLALVKSLSHLLRKRRNGGRKRRRNGDVRRMRGRKGSRLQRRNTLDRRSWKR